MDIDDAEARLIRFAPFIRRMFPEVADGIIESELKEITAMKEALAAGRGSSQKVDVKGRLFLKMRQPPAYIGIDKRQEAGYMKC